MVTLAPMEARALLALQIPIHLVDPVHVLAMLDTMALMEAYVQLALQIPIHLEDPMHVLAMLVTMAPVEAHAFFVRLYRTGLTMAQEPLLPTARIIAILGT